MHPYTYKRKYMYIYDLAEKGAGRPISLQPDVPQR